MASLPPLIVALDLASVAEAEALAERLGGGVVYKIGYRLAFTGGLDLAWRLIRAGRAVFLDLKLHDIGNTVEEGVRALADGGAAFLTVHAYPQTMRAAVAGRGGSALKLLAVTVLTSYDQADLAAAGYAGDVETLVGRRAGQAAEAGIDGVVCAAPEAGLVRARLGPAGLVVTPGIRPPWAEAGDQKRVVTPAEAVRLGADHIVVGRPITGAADPRAAAERIIADMGTA